LELRIIKRIYMHMIILHIPKEIDNSNHNSLRNVAGMGNPTREIAANHEAYKLLVISHVRSTHPRKHGYKIQQAEMISSSHLITAKLSSGMDVTSKISSEKVSNWTLFMF